MSDGDERTRRVSSTAEGYHFMRCLHAAVAMLALRWKLLLRFLQKITIALSGTTWGLPTPLLLMRRFAD